MVLSVTFFSFENADNLIFKKSLLNNLLFLKTAEGTIENEWTHAVIDKDLLKNIFLQ